MNDTPSCGNVPLYLNDFPARTLTQASPLMMKLPLKIGLGSKFPRLRDTKIHNHDDHGASRKPSGHCLIFILTWMIDYWPKNRVSNSKGLAHLIQISCKYPKLTRKNTQFWVTRARPFWIHHHSHASLPFSVLSFTWKAEPNLPSYCISHTQSIPHRFRNFSRGVVSTTLRAYMVCTREEENSSKMNNPILIDLWLMTASL